MDNAKKLKIAKKEIMHTCIDQKINDIASKKRTAQGGCIKSKDGKILMQTSDILERWSEYIQEIFYDERGHQPENRKPIEGPPILKAEVEKTIKDEKW
ncbi:hypothetical protein ElyMa_002001100 [Elysia marginata]|uniref:Uncharacterized protein n=1 Tax=Elysia marginata TaxID=1093978 RepID=A0AAV4F2R3_9GAST|nr:hypothetical protein ElyMa_002001100 [Elysia marginata]